MPTGVQIPIYLASSARELPTFDYLELNGDLAFPTAGEEPVYEILMEKAPEIP